MRAERIRNTQAGAQVVRIGDPIQHEEQDLCAGCSDHVLYAVGHLHRFHPSHHTLMLAMSDQALKPFRVYRDYTDVARLGCLHQVAQAGIMAPAVDEDLPHAVRMVPQPCSNCVKAEDELGIAHQRPVAAGTKSSRVVSRSERASST